MKDETFNKIKHLMISSREINYSSMVYGKNIFKSILLKALSAITVQLVNLTFELKYFRIHNAVSRNPEILIQRMFYHYNGKRYLIKNAEYLVYNNTLPHKIKRNNHYYKLIKSNYRNTSRKMREKIKDYVVDVYDKEIINGYWQDTKQDEQLFKKQIVAYLKDTNK